MVVSCSEWQDELSSLVDGELGQHRQDALSEHLSGCDSCRRTHDEFQGLSGILQGQSACVQKTAPDLWSTLSVSLPSVCECVQDDLSAYLDGELIAPAKEGVTEHLENCQVCLQKFRDLSNVTGLLSEGLVLPAAVEVDIWSGLKNRLNDDCLLIKSELSAFIDKEVATLRHRAITSHLTECEGCTRDFNELSDAGDILRSAYQPPEMDNLDVWSGIKSRLNVVEMEPKEKRRPAMAIRRLYAAAAAAVVGVAAASGIIYYSQTRADIQSVQPVTAEAYLIDQSLGDPSDVAEAVVYDHND